MYIFIRMYFTFWKLQKNESSLTITAWDVMRIVLGCTREPECVIMRSVHLCGGGGVKPQAGMTSCGIPLGKGGCLCLSGTSGSGWGSLAPMDLRLALILVSESHTPRKGLATTGKVLRSWGAPGSRGDSGPSRRGVSVCNQCEHQCTCSP